MYHRMYNFLWILGEPKKNERVLSNYGLKTEGTSVRGVKVHGRSMNATPPLSARFRHVSLMCAPFHLSLDPSLSLCFSHSFYMSLFLLSPLLSLCALSLCLSPSCLTDSLSHTLALCLSLPLFSLSPSLWHTLPQCLSPRLSTPWCCATSLWDRNPFIDVCSAA